MNLDAHRLMLARANQLEYRWQPADRQYAQQFAQVCQGSMCLQTLWVIHVTVIVSDETRSVLGDQVFDILGC